MIFKNELRLENAHVRLEPLNQSHFEALLPIALANPKLLQFSPSPFGSAEELRANINSAIEGREKEVRYAFAIFHKQQNRFVGSTSFGNLSMANERIEIGWTWLSPEVQGTGFNKRCKQLLLAHAFDTLQLERVEFRIDSRNVASRKGVEKIGGKLEGELRNHTILLDGFRRNTVIYSILKSEWSNLKQTTFDQT
jgi:RimJ/RimL family protein N-acetyltransferase